MKNPIHIYGFLDNIELNAYNELMYKKKSKIPLSETHPELAKEWHPTKNSLLASQITYGSGKKSWWLGNCGHEWLETPNQRTNNKRSCPYCYGRKINESNCLASLNPELAKEWHPLKNSNLTPFDVPLHYGKKVWWKCQFGHEWETTVDKRSNGRKCPYCSNKKIDDKNSFGVKYPELAKEWHPTKNGSLTPYQVAPNCGKIVWWMCHRGHEWQTRVCDHSNGRFSHICISLVDTHPELVKEWHPTKNTVLPSQVTYGSLLKVWWVGKCGHEWKSTILGRAGKRKFGCPKCKPSKKQKLLLWIIQNIFPNEVIEFDYKDNNLRFPDTGFKLELDIFMPNKNVAFEYQGEQHFKPVLYWGGIDRFKRGQEKDRLKKIVCKENNIRLLEVPYTWKGDKEFIQKLLEDNG